MVNKRRNYETFMYLGEYILSYVISKWAFYYYSFG